MERRYKTGFTFGVYDLFHVGHLNLLRRAKERCERLIVGISDDLTAITFKGKQPLIPVEQRAEIIKAVRYVDEVHILGPEYASKKTSWERFRYDCFFSGDDWKNDKGYIEEGEWLREQGSDLVFFPYTEGRTSTGLRESLRLAQNGFDGKLAQLFEDMAEGAFDTVPAALWDVIASGQKVALYGCGRNGTILFDRIQSSVCCFVDKFKGGVGYKHKDAPVYTLEEFRDKEPEMPLFVTPFLLCEDGAEKDEFLRECKALSINRTVFLDSEYLFSCMLQGLLGIEKCLHVMALLGDCLSRYQYYEFIRCHLFAEPFRPPYLNPKWQYHAPELFELGEEDYIIDCGAFDGDTVKSFSNAYPKLRGITAFEPTPSTFARLSDVCEREYPYPVRAVNKGVGETDGTLFLDAGSGVGASGNHLSDESFPESIPVPVCVLDNEVFDLRPSFIKMDIEGMELAALTGAQAIIREYHPILAICIYHKAKDLFEIPLYIERLFPGYQLFVRKYGESHTELVLYAIPPERRIH